MLRSVSTLPLQSNNTLFSRVFLLGFHLLTLSENTKTKYLLSVLPSYELSVHHFKTLNRRSGFYKALKEHLSSFFSLLSPSVLPLVGLEVKANTDLNYTVPFQLKPASRMGATWFGYGGIQCFIQEIRFKLSLA